MFLKKYLAINVDKHNANLSTYSQKKCLRMNLNTKIKTLVMALAIFMCTKILSNTMKSTMAILSIIFRHFSIAVHYYHVLFRKLKPENWKSS